MIDLARYDHARMMSSPPTGGINEELHLEIKTEHRALIRPLLRDTDWLLNVGGRATWSSTECMARTIEVEACRVLGHRYTISRECGRVCLTKRIPRRDGPSSGPWTLAVISGGGNEERLRRIFKSVEAQSGWTEFELLIVGPKPLMDLPQYARHVPFEEDPVDPRFPITRKKNLVAKSARYENLLILHDRFRLGPNWYQAISRLRPDWDVLLCRMTPENSDSRLADWNETLQDPVGTLCSRYFESYPFNPETLIHSNLDYDQYSDRVIVNGGAFAVKRAVLLDVPIAEHLFWAEIEDGDWSARLKTRGILISLANNAVLETLSDDGHRPAALSGHLGRLTAGGTRRIRTAVLRCFDLIRDRATSTPDFFSRKGFFSRSRFLTINLSTLKVLGSLDWSKLDGIVVRGNAAEIKNLREPLLRLEAAVPAGKDLILEFVANGHGFFRRSGYRRSCESVFYEAGCAWKNSFELKHFLTARDHTSFLWFQRREPIPRVLRSLAVMTRGSVDAKEVISFLNRICPSWYDATEEELQSTSADAVFHLADPAALGMPADWRATYDAFGQVRAFAGDRLLDDNFLIESTKIRPTLALCSTADTRCLPLDFERAAILEGLLPFAPGQTL